MDIFKDLSACSLLDTRRLLLSQFDRTKLDQVLDDCIEHEKWIILTVVQGYLSSCMTALLKVSLDQAMSGQGAALIQGLLASHAVLQPREVNVLHFPEEFPASASH